MQLNVGKQALPFHLLPISCIISPILNLAPRDEVALCLDHLQRGLGTASCGPDTLEPYRLLDSTNYRKSVDKLLLLLRILDCEVELVVRAKSA